MVNAGIDDFVGVVLGQDDRGVCAQCFAQLLFQLTEIWSISPQHMPPMRKLKLNAEHTDIDRADSDDSRYMRNEQTRDRRRPWIDLDIDRQALFAQSVEDLCEAGRPRIGGIEANSATLQLYCDATFGTEHLNGRPIERRLETYYA